MNDPTTAGLQLGRGSRALREAVELLSSMRFAISLLTLICIASVIGTVVKQNEPFVNYVNQFGPFWAELFAQLGLFTVYSAPWFLLILAFLVVSTSLCIARNAPKILADLRQYREGVREQALLAFHHRGEGVLPQPRDAALQRVAARLAAQGWRARIQRREGGVMIGARKGRSNRLGYIAAHSAIVAVCIGGLLDGDLIVRAQMWLKDKSSFNGSGLIAEVPARHRLAADNPTFRGNLFVAEGERAGIAVLNMPDGVVLQDLPFDVELKRFIVEYYPTGMPRLFASEIVVHDRADGSATPHRVEVNKPAFHKGVAIYQSSFDDGGSRVKLRARPLLGPAAGFEVEGRIGGKTELVAGGENGERLSLEFTALRVINVENLAGGQADGGATDVRAVDLVQGLHSRLGSAQAEPGRKTQQNVGPSISYKLRDAAGQAREFHNYMAPVELDGRQLFLFGVRDTPQQSFRYLRLPADENASLDGWLRLRRALAEPALRDEAARRYGRAATPPGRPEMTDQLVATARRTLALFAGAEPPAKSDGAAASPSGGLQALADFIETSVPTDDRMRISEVMLRILSGSLVELNQIARAADGLAPLPADERTEAFMTQALTSISDSFLYPAPLLLQLQDFTQVQASVFQVTRAPGKTLVYIGAVLLIVGVFMMLYVRDRRLWVWLQDDVASGGTRLRTALSSTRRTLDGDAEFERLRAELLQTAQEAPPR